MASPEPNIVLRVVWFIFVGWWLSQLVILAGWFFNLTIIGIPLGMYLLNRVPQAATLKSSRKTLSVTTDAASGAQVYGYTDAQQRPFWLRALYFIFIGSWLSLLWLETAWLFAVLVITMPLAFWMFGAAGKVTTLRR